MRPTGVVPGARLTAWLARKCDQLTARQCHPTGRESRRLKETTVGPRGGAVIPSQNPEIGRRCRDRVFEFVDASLVAPAATVVQRNHCLRSVRLRHHQVRGLRFAGRVHPWGFGCRRVRLVSPAKFVASKITSAPRNRSGGALSHGFASVPEGDEAVRSRCFAGGSISCEMLRLGYITEKSQAAPRFSSRIGQTACS